MRDFKPGEILLHRFTPSSPYYRVEFLRMSPSGKMARVKHLDDAFFYESYVKPKNLHRPKP